MNPTRFTIEYLSAYLPYKLKLKTNHSGQIVTMMSVQAVSFNGQISVQTELGTWGNFHFKPILRRPESLTTDEIVESGLDNLMVRSIDKYGLVVEYSEDEINRTDLHHFGTDTDIPYDIVKILLSLHVDVFSLIDAGLAIDINKLTKS